MLWEAATFLAHWGAWFALFYIFLHPFEYALQSFETLHVRFALSLVGVDTVSASLANQFFMNGKLIEISPLCSGLLEMILLATAILATKTEKVYTRLRGVMAGVVVLYLFNIMRMAVTLLQLEHESLEFATITHDILFRLALIIGFALLYGAWLNRIRLREWAAHKALF